MFFSTAPLTFTIRPANAGLDGPGIVALINTFESVPVTLERFHQWEAYQPEGRVCRRMVAVDDQGELVGYSQASHETWYSGGEFYIWVVVDPQKRGRGVGSSLYEDALTFVESQGAGALKSEVRDDDETGLRFATRRGMVFNRHLYASVLELEGFDESPYAALRPALEAEGIRFFSMAEVGDTPEMRRKLYEVNLETGLDVPGSSSSWMPFEEFNQLICGADWYRPAGQLFAADGDQWIGLAAVRLIHEEGLAYNLMTGVCRPYRGRKIAQALKLEAIRYARQHGMKAIQTDNDSLNAPMLAVNRKFGYRPLPGKFFLKGEL